MNNVFKTILLLGLLSVILIFLGSAIAGREGAIYTFIISFLINGGAYFFSDRIALSSSKARLLEKDRHPKIHRMVERLAKQMNIPKPNIYITPATQANAFATGRNPKNASIALTQGLLETLTEKEVESVIAHELAHVKNRDMLVATVAAVLASTVAFLSRMAMFGSAGDNRRGNSLISLAVLLLAPLGAMLIRFAVSRQREYLADHTGARTLGTGKDLESALIKIHRSAQQRPMTDLNPAFASLYIGNPFEGLTGRLNSLFSTHPPLEQRIKNLRAYQ